MTQVPLRIEVDAEDARLALPFVILEFDGRPTEALLDTGAARTSVIAWDGLATRSAGRSGGGSAFGHRADDDLVGDVSCEFAGRELGMIMVTVVAADQVGHGALVGQDILSRFRCEYRLADELLVIDSDRAPREEYDIHLDAGRHVYLAADWGSSSTTGAVFDTGASVTVVDQQFAARHPDLFSSAGTSAGTDASGETVETPMALMAGPTILGRRFAESPVAIVDLGAVNRTLDRPMDLILGWPVISQAGWIIDHARAKAGLS
jgi:hypothetical protein